MIKGLFDWILGRSEAANKSTEPINPGIVSAGTQTFAGHKKIAPVYYAAQRPLTAPEAAELLVKSKRKAEKELEPQVLEYLQTIQNAIRYAVEREFKNSTFVYVSYKKPEAPGEQEVFGLLAEMVIKRLEEAGYRAALSGRGYSIENRVYRRFWVSWSFVKSAEDCNCKYGIQDSAYWTCEHNKKSESKESK